MSGATMTSDELNAAIHEIDGGKERKAVPYWGWFWRDVDFDADSCRLATSGSAAPEWWTSSAEYLLGIPWGGRRTAFCENNKWGYPEFEISGEPWAKLRGLVEALVATPTKDAELALQEHLLEITPAEADMEPGW